MTVGNIQGIIVPVPVPAPCQNMTKKSSFEIPAEMNTKY